jgi:hypothetical protein
MKKGILIRLFLFIIAVVLTLPLVSISCGTSDTEKSAPDGIDKNTPIFGDTTTPSKAATPPPGQAAAPTPKQAATPNPYEVATPKIYLANMALNMSCSTAYALIYYTTDGTIPTKLSTLYTQPLTSNPVPTITAKAFNLYTNTESLMAVWPPPTPTTQLNTPVISPPGGQFTNPTLVSISWSPLTAIIYFTTDGTIPTSNSRVYYHPGYVDYGMTIKAMAYISNNTYQSRSSVASATYTFIVATPTFSPSNRTFTDNMQVSISCGTTGSTIRRTNNGSEPTSSSPAYTGPITIYQTTTIKAKAFKSGMVESNTATATYTKSIGKYQ